MLPAIGAASLALDAIQSLTSSQQASSQPIGGFGPALSGPDSSSAASPASSTTISGFSSAQISPGSFNALIDAQAIDAGGSISGSSSITAPGTASSTYGAVNQLMQSTAVPLGFSPVSVSA